MNVDILSLRLVQNMVWPKVHFLNGRNDLTKNIPCMNRQGAVPKPRGTVNFI